MTSQIPVIAIVGKGDSGKTTFLEKLIRELASRGYRVATVKHHVHDFDIDVPGKDSWRHGRAGAVTTMVSSPTKFSLIRETEGELSLDELSAVAGDCGCDLLLAEGFKRASSNRIEVSRAARSEELVCDPSELLALVTDNPNLTSRGLPTFGLDDAQGVSDLVVSTFLTSTSTSDPSAGVPRAVPQARSAEDCLSTGAPTQGSQDDQQGGDNDGN